MSIFHPLPIIDVRAETADAISVAFAVPPELRRAFAFSAGQFVTLRHPIAGQEVRRAYSICSAPHEGQLRVAIKRLEGGLFSAFAHAELRPGMVLEVARPSGRFTVALDPQATRTYAAFAAGSGITPILSIVKTVLAGEPNSRFVLLYGNRTQASVIFREELEDLKNRYLARLSVHHLFSREAQDVPAASGRLERTRALALCRAFCPPQVVDRYFVCGPAAMIDDVRDALASLGASPEQVLFERFTPPEARSAPGGDRVGRRARAQRQHGLAAVTVVAEGASTAFEMPFAGETLIEAGIRQGLDLPYACKTGVCGACRCRIVEGEVEMAAHHALAADEVASGFVLACQARAVARRIVADFDQAWTRPA